MKREHREEEILDLVRRGGFARVEDLAGRFGVTQQTIRRDINELSDRGLLRRFHGGAGLPSSVENLAYSTRQVLHLEQKRRIAGLVARHIPDQASLFLNLGTTTEEVAKRLTGHRGLRVITNNLNVASIMGRDPHNEVIVASGMVRARDLGITGEATIECIRQFKVDYGIIGISGIDEDGTLRDYDFREVQVSRVIVEQSRKVLLVADRSKFGRQALVRLGHLSLTDALFTDEPPPEAMRAMLGDAGVRVYVASEEAGMAEA